MRDAHLPEPVLRSYLDAELDREPLAAAARHLRSCPACRAQLSELVTLDREVGRLLAGAGVVRPHATTNPSALPRRSYRLGVAIATVAAVLLVALVAPRGGPTRPSAGAGVRDVCCWDLDGGGRGDDGVFTLSRDGEVVECAIVYDDIDHSRSLTAADVVRIGPSADACGRPGAEPRRSTPPPG